MADIFPTLDEHWEAILSDLEGPFTTQTFRARVEERAPEVWTEMVRRWGPGGKGSGSFYSPANVLYNYLNKKAGEHTVIARGFVPSAEGWGANVVMLWSLVGGPETPFPESDRGFIEGQEKYRTHLIREREAGIRSRLLQRREAVGLSCDLCGMTGEGFDEDIRRSVFEAHHDTSPLSAGKRQTRLDDMALLCACCHRALHRLVVLKKRWFTVSEARKPLGLANRGKPAG